MIFIIIFVVTDGSSKNFPFKIIDIKNISRYNENRVSFQHIQKNINDETDNSISSLLIINKRKIYLFKDGYDNFNDIRTKRLILETQKRLIPDDLWTNTIDSKPDYIRITDRRVEILRNENQDFVTKNFGDFYLKIRNSFIQKHVNIFKTLLITRKESGLHVKKIPIPKRLGDTSSETKFVTSVTAKTVDEKLYYAEDADGDGITETFFVNIPDGFNWGYKSGPNILCIYNNQDPEIQKIIGKITHEAYHGTAEEEEIIKKTFPKDDDIVDLINDAYRVLEPEID